MSTFDAIMLIILAIATISIITVDVMLQKKKIEGNVSLNLDTAKDIASSVIQHVALALLTEAERTFGSGTGELKMSYCIAKLIELLPEAVVQIVPKKELKDLLEAALSVAKEKWLKNPRLLDKEE